MNEIGPTVSFEGFSDTVAKMEAARSRYSELFEQRADSQEVVKQAAARRAEITKALKRATAALHTGMEDAVQQAITDPFAGAATDIPGLRARVEILSRSSSYFAAFAFADVERAHIIAEIAELQSQVELEQWRLTAHEEHVVVLLGPAAELAGDVSIAGFGSMSDGIKAIIANVTTQLQNARERLKRRDAATSVARSEYERGVSNG